MSETAERFDLQQVCSLIEEQDMSYGQIAKQFGFKKDDLRNWVEADPTRSARVREARRYSAEMCERDAMEEIKKLPSDATKADIARVREYAHHRRWQAKVRFPERYGDKTAVEHSGTVTTRKAAELSDDELAAELAAEK